MLSWLAGIAAILMHQLHLWLDKPLKAFKWFTISDPVVFYKLYFPTYLSKSKLAIPCYVPEPTNSEIRKWTKSRSPSIQATPSIYPIGGFGYYWAADLTPHCGKSQGLILCLDWSKNNWFYTPMNSTSRDSCFIQDQPYINLCSDNFPKFSVVDRREINFLCPIKDFFFVWNPSLASLG